MVLSGKFRWGWLAGLVAVVVFSLLAEALLLFGSDGASKKGTSQTGYRGTGMSVTASDATLKTQALLQAAPPIASAARARPNGPIAGKVYKNVQVLGDLPLGEFGRTMSEITNWIAPNESCAYCHVEGNFADDAKYTKVVARRMFQMVQQINANWKTHVAGTGVTCYTCHRGKALPQQRWFRQAPQAPGADGMGGRPAPHQVQVRAGSLPNNPLDTFLLDATSPSIRVASPRALAQYSGAPVQRAESTYALMMHVSQSLGVNCTFCHNTRAFANWDESSPKRQVAWYGIRMVRDVNTQFLEPLGPTFAAAPAGRLGPSGDAAKVSCATCHLGANKPLNGAQMAQHYPALLLAPKAAVLPPAAEEPPVPDAIAVQAAASAAATAATTAATTAAPSVATAGVASAAAPARLVASAPPAGVVAAVPAPPAPQPQDDCAALDASASRPSFAVPAAQAGRQVKGTGRLQFYTAPAGACVMKGIFILPREAVTALASQGGYTRVKYVNPRTGLEVTGWVDAQRVAAE